MFGDLGFVCSFAGRSFPIESLLNSTIVSSPSCCFLIPTVKYGLSYYLAYCISYRVASLSGSVEGKCIWRGEHRDGTGTCHTGRAIAAVPMSRARRSSRVKARVVRLTTCLPSRFGSYDFDLDEDLGPDELWDDQQHRRRARLTEIARANFRVGRNIVCSRQILCDLYDISNGHTAFPRMPIICCHASSAWPVMSLERPSPFTARPGVPEVISQRKFGLASMASL